MNRNDQFSGFDEATRTVIRPNPGGRRPQPCNSAPPQTPWWWNYAICHSVKM